MVKEVGAKSNASTKTELCSNLEGVSDLPVSSFGSHGASLTSLRASLKLTSNHSAKRGYLSRDATLTILFWTGNFSSDTSVRCWISSLLSWGFWSLLLESVRSDCGKSFKMASGKQPAFITHAHIYQLRSLEAGDGAKAKWASSSVLSVHQSRAFLLLRIYLPVPSPAHWPSPYSPIKTSFIFSITLPLLLTLTIPPRQTLGAPCLFWSLFYCSDSPQIGRQRPETILAYQAKYQKSQ